MAVSHKPRPVLPVRTWNGADCAKCSLCPESTPLNPVRGIGPDDPVLVVVGEAPGSVEVRKGRPFLGPSGRLLWETLNPSGSSVQPPRIYATNALLCMPDYGKTTTSKQVACCRPRLTAELERLTGVQVIFLVGAKAAEAVLGRKVSISGMNGRSEWSEMYHAWLVFAYHPAAVLRKPDLYPDFKYACSVAREACGWESGPAPVPQITHTVCNSTDDVLEVVARLRTLPAGSPIACDLETTGLSPINDRVLEVGFAGNDSHAWIVPADLLDDMPAYLAVKDLLEDRRYTWVYHNGKFDINMLVSALGIEARVGGDTLLLHHALDERGGGAEGGHHDLKSLAARYCGAPDYASEIDGKDMANVHPVLRWRYHAQDLVYTYRLYGILRHELEKEPPSRDGWPTPLENHDRFLVPAANAIADVELRGIHLDQQRWLTLHDEYLDRSLETIKRIREQIGVADFNPNSPLQVAAQLTRMGYPSLNSTAEEAIHQLQALDADAGREPNPFLTDVLDYRSLRHTRNTYIVGLGKSAIKLGDGRVRTHLLMHGTGTGRLASRDLNLQNVPKDSPIREMFIPTPGYTFVEADYAQLEVRVLAWYSRDLHLLQTIKAKDVHWATASTVWPAVTRDMVDYKTNLERLEEICRGMAMFQDFWIRQRSGSRTSDPAELYDWMVTRIRRQAKYVTFGIMYGEGAESLSKGEKGLGVSKEEAQTYINDWRAAYPTAYAWLARQARYARVDRWVESALGRRRRFFYPDGLSHVANEAMNFPIQSFASDINLGALVRLNRELRESSTGYVLLPVHDSLLCEVRTELLDAGKASIRHAMTHVVQDPDVVFEVDLKVGSNWASLHK